MSFDLPLSPFCISCRVLSTVGLVFGWVAENWQLCEVLGLVCGMHVSRMTWSKTRVFGFRVIWKMGLGEFILRCKIKIRYRSWPFFT